MYEESGKNRAMMAALGEFGVWCGRSATLTRYESSRDNWPLTQMRSRMQIRLFSNEPSAPAQVPQEITVLENIRLKQYESCPNRKTEELVSHMMPSHAGGNHATKPHDLYVAQ